MTRLIFSFFALLLIATPTLSFAQLPKKTEQTAAERLAKVNSIREELKTEREERLKRIEEFKAGRTADRLEKSRSVADHLISERLKALNRLLDTGHTKKCRTEAKTEIEGLLSVVEDRLQSQKSEIESSANVEEVRALIKNGIVGKNHVFVVVLPAIRGMCVADGLIGLIDGRLAEAVTKLQTAGADTTILETHLANAKTDAEAAYASYKAAATNPTTEARTNLAAAKAKLKEAKEDLVLAKTEIGKLKESLDTDD